MQCVTAVADASGVIAVHALLVIMARLESITYQECIKTNDVPCPSISHRLPQLLSGPFASTGCFQASAMEAKTVKRSTLAPTVQASCKRSAAQVCNDNSSSPSVRRFVFGEEKEL